MRNGTYSIVACDPESGELGVAVQSHWFSVGSVVTWARPGVGAAATQSIAEPAHGPHMLDALVEGRDAPSAIARVLERDELAEYRQLGLVDAAGNAASFTGPDCIVHAGDVVGPNFACQANMMANEGVPEAMAGAYRAAEGDLAERLLLALEAAEDAGGDVRGRQSAALLVVPAVGERWRARFDVRVEDSPEPLVEIRRLVRLARAYEMAGAADELLAAGDQGQANALYTQAAEMAPESDELIFWAGVGIAGQDIERGLELVRGAIAVNGGWELLLRRLPAELAPSAQALAQALDVQP